jgi:death on curing protein
MRLWDAYRAYKVFHTIEEVAGLYAETIAKGHVFNDGNKRTALVSMLTFLDLNGYQLMADQDGIADKMVELSDGIIDHKELAIWLKPKLLKA